ncbi:MAG: SpoIIIAH-like family protein [Peptococcaceae bacterium]|nr:SpoIIIAH-like family protein [Peptococcaceae bacterium]
MIFRTKSVIIGSVFLLFSVIFFFLFSNGVKAKADNEKSADVLIVSVDPDVIVTDFIKDDFKDFSFEMVELTNDQGQNYFVNYRIKREKFRYEIKEMLELLLESDIKQTRQEAQLRWLELSNKISKEDEVENTLKMRGFKDVVSEVNPEKVTITLLEENLTIQEHFIVKNVVNSITGFEEERIEIILKPC